MKKMNITWILSLILVILISNVSYAREEKSILILLDELNFEYIEKLLNNDFGIGFVNLKTRKPTKDESLYFSIATGRKVGVKSGDYKGLYKNKDGSINVVGFEEMFKNLTKGSKNIKEDILGEKLKDKGISYIGNSSSAIIASDNIGNIKSGEVELNYDINWLIDKTEFHLSDSSLLVLSYNIDETNHRIEILEEYIENFKDHNIMILPETVSKDMKYIINNTITPFIYINGGINGTINSSSTKREGFITLEDIYVELLSIHDEKPTTVIGNEINIVEKENNLDFTKILFKKNINLIWLTYIFHGIVYFIQCYFAYYIYKNRIDKLNATRFLYSYVIINIFISLLMGTGNLHINIVLYLFINLLTTYIITAFMADIGIDIIGLFATATYGLILFGIFFYPELIYNSYIGFNNLFYGARYYGFNNGIMGVLLATSIISYYFVRDLISNELIKDMVFLLYFLLNMVGLSAKYGANTGGFITSVILFLAMIYIHLLGRSWNIKNIGILLLAGILIFSVNMYFDYLSNEKSHAINFLIRIKTFGINEFLNMLSIKVRELVKLTLLPPFSIAIISQIFSLKALFKNINIKKEAYIILITGIVGFLINDTGMITFIYMIHYLIAFLIYKNSIDPI